VRTACYNRCTIRVVIQIASLSFTFLALSGASNAQSWKILTTGTDSNLRGVSAAKISSTNRITVWVSGSHGAVFRSIDDGATWSRLTIPGSSELDFRGVVAFSEKIAYVMASGEGEKSRIYKTADGGANWELQLKDTNKAFFLDSIACHSETKCFALADPIDGKFVVLETSDGRHWNKLPPANLPAALAKEGGFAASNSNLLVVSDDEFYFVTGGFAARILHTGNGGKSWNAASAPIAGDNASSGIFAIQRANDGRLLLVGGDYASPTIALRIAAISTDGGKSWQPASQQPSGYRSAVAALDANETLTVGPNGSDRSVDAGAHWKSVSTLPLNAIFALDAQHVWTAGPNGTIARFVTARN
jgi:photosystem II stability/assembly factor-like uncharacterized protein